MNTKTSVFLGIASLAALAACSKVEPFIPDTPITFTVASYMPQTRAGESLFLTESGGKFYSRAYLHAKGFEEDEQLFFGAYETINYNNGTSEWAPSHEYYWPKHAESYINFFSWFDNAASVTPPTIAETSTGATLSWGSRTIGKDDNLMFADAAWHYNKNPKSTENNANPGPANTYGNDGVTEGVPTLFHHALAKLSIKVKMEDPNIATTDKTTWEISLSNIKLSSVHKEGKLDLSTTAKSSTGTSSWVVSGTTNAPVVWVSTDTASDITMDAPTSSISTEATTILSDYSVLPQAITEDMKLSFDCQIFTYYDKTNNATPYSKEKFNVSVKIADFTSFTDGANHPVETPDAWKMNTKITYNISINPKTSQVKFDPAVEDWAVLNGGSYIVQ